MSGVWNYKDDGNPPSKFCSLDFLYNNVFSIEDYSNYKSILDVGSGNGRFNSLYRKYFNKINNIEPYVKIDSRFNYENVVLYKEKFEDFKTNKKFDVISFIFNLYIFLWDNDHKKVIERCFNMLNTNGIILIIEMIPWAFPEYNHHHHYDIVELSKPYKNSKLVKIQDTLFYAILKK
jgi:SAM-dependent methyltransferase